MMFFWFCRQLEKGLGSVMMYGRIVKVSSFPMVARDSKDNWERVMFEVGLFRCFGKGQVVRNVHKLRIWRHGRNG